MVLSGQRSVLGASVALRGHVGCQLLAYLLSLIKHELSVRGLRTLSVHGESTESQGPRSLDYLL